jgi:structural maintenance of chromosome 4
VKKNTWCCINRHNHPRLLSLAPCVLVPTHSPTHPCFPVVSFSLSTCGQLENFKSYAGKKTIGPMHHRFNAIIGPNGSGKSNVIDAMMFVFGKRAKKLRLKKVSELIHNSAEFPNFTHARVNVHFVNVVDNEEGEGVTEVPGTECIISRVANKNNSSTYKIDNKNATFAQVAAALDTRNIDLKNNRFLILQGEVELISQMKPLGTAPGETGLLEYLEDIIGSNKFVEPIVKANAEYDGSEENRTQAKNRMRASEKTKEGLKGSRDDVLAFQNAQRAVASKRNLLWHKKKIIRANEATRMEKEREDMNAIHAEAMKEFQHDEATLKECEKNIKTLKKDHTKLEKETDDWREKYAQFERKDVKMREDLLFNKGEKKKLSKLSKKLTLISNTCVEKITQLEADAPQREQDVESAGAALKKAEAQLEAVEATLKGKTEALRTELSEVRKELKPLGKLADAAQGEMEECKSEIDLVQTRSLNARKKYEKLNQQLINAQECVEGHGEEVAKLQKEMGLKSTRVEAAKEELMAVQQEEQTVLASIENIRNSRDTIQNELATLQTTSGASKATGMLAALQSQEAGVGDDLLGRLGDLGKYH